MGVGLYDNPTCAYCGAVLSLRKIFDTFGTVKAWYFVCENCGASTGPKARRIDAWASAHRREKQTLCRHCKHFDKQEGNCRLLRIPVWPDWYCRDAEKTGEKA